MTSAPSILDEKLKSALWCSDLRTEKAEPSTQKKTLWCWKKNSFDGLKVLKSTFDGSLLDPWPPMAPESPSARCWSMSGSSKKVWNLQRPVKPRRYGYYEVYYEAYYEVYMKYIFWSLYVCIYIIHIYIYMYVSVCVKYRWSIWTSFIENGYVLVDKVWQSRDAFFLFSGLGLFPCYTVFAAFRNKSLSEMDGMCSVLDL